MKTGIRSGVSYKTQYKAYKDTNRWQKNKIKKLERRIAENPQDKGAVAALAIANKKTYNRGKPGQKGWFHPQEQNFLKMTGSSDPKIAEFARNKLAKIRAIYADERPSALRRASETAGRQTVADQLCEEGLINEKRKNTVNARMERVRGR